MNSFKTFVGLEVHIELATKSKMFCSCKAFHFGQKPNTNTCPICLGLPGALPFVNQEAINFTLKFGLAFSSLINNFSKFDRKHYFYPDLPKGYQISQYDLPLCREGKFQIPNSPPSPRLRRAGNLQIRIRRIHLEEDTAKLVHQFGISNNGGVSLVDFNRSGVALLELVTEPDFANSSAVISFVKEIQLIARYLNISDCNMEKGSMRLEANVSLAKGTRQKALGNSLPDYKVELKNINSFTFLEKAINSEIVRQKDLLERGEKISQETRGFDERTGATFSQRTKEEAKDYRYFPEPDIPPITITNSQISKLESEIPELPQAKRLRFKKEFNLPPDFIEILVSDKNRADYFEAALRLAQGKLISAKVIAGVMVNKKLDEQFPEPAGLVKKIKELFKVEPASSDEVADAVRDVLAAEPKAINDYNKGKGEVVGFLIGQVQKRLKGKGDTQKVKKLLLERLKSK